MVSHIRAPSRVHRQEYPKPVVEGCGSNYPAPAISAAERIADLSRQCVNDGQFFEHFSMETQSMIWPQRSLHYT